MAAGTAWSEPLEDSVRSGLRGPVIGYVHDANRQVIRPVTGIPRSSLLGQPLALPFPVAAAGFSTRGDFAVAVSAAADRGAHMLRHLDATPDVEPIPGALSGADRVILNADASAAALLASDSHQLQIVRGLPASPAAEPAIDLSLIPGTITALAIDRLGANILIAASADRGELYLVSTAATDLQSAPRLIATFASPPALALLHGDRDVIVAVAAVHELTLLHNFAGVPEAVRLAGERDGISGPTGLQISADESKLYIANGTARTLDIWNFQTQSIEASFPLDAEATRLTPFQGSSTFLLNDVGEHPLLLLDAAAENSEVYFVPAGRD
jgi:hypothetical protein